MLTYTFVVCQIFCLATCNVPGMMDDTGTWKIVLLLAELKQSNASSQTEHDLLTSTSLGTYL